jgi:hypothetical protein
VAAHLTADLHRPQGCASTSRQPLRVHWPWLAQHGEYWACADPACEQRVVGKGFCDPCIRPHCVVPRPTWLLIVASVDHTRVLDFTLRAVSRSRPHPAHLLHHYPAKGAPGDAAASEDVMGP